MWEYRLSWIGAQTVLWAQLLLASPVVLWIGQPFFQRGWSSIVNRSPNMWTLIAIGTGAAYLYSLVAVLMPGLLPTSLLRPAGTPPVYFEAAAVILILVLVGQIRSWWPASAPATPTAARPTQTARRVTDNGEDVPLDSVIRGDQPGPTG